MVCSNISAKVIRSTRSLQWSDKSRNVKMSRLFYNYGKFCASHPWEVMVAFLTLSICMFSMGPSGHHESNFMCKALDGTPTSCYSKEALSGDVVLVTITRCLALLYVYHQFRNLYKLGSKYLVGIAGLFTVFSSFVFSSGVINFLNGDFSELNTAMPLFLLLADLPKACLLAQFALSSYTREEVRKNIARGMSILGPSLTLDTMVETLAIGVGTLSGVKRMEDLSYLACLSVIVNYIIFMTFFPACLSLALELSHSQEGKPVWQFSSLAKVLQVESEQAPNPVIQRVKLIMSAGLMLVHTLSRWQLEGSRGSLSESNSSSDATSNFYTQDNIDFYDSHIRKYFMFGYEQLVMVGLVFALAVKYIFFDSKDNEMMMMAATQQSSSYSYYSESTQTTSSERGASPDRRSSPATPTITISQDSDTESVIIDGHPRLDDKRKSSFFIGDNVDDTASESSEDIETVDKEIQTIESNIEEALVPFKKVDAEPRPLDQLIALLASEEGHKELTDDEVILLVTSKRLQAYRLESALEDPTRGVKIRRLLLEKTVPLGKHLYNLPYLHYDYSLVMGACCENVVGYMPIPVGIAGPLLLNGREFHVPMATTEGCLVASTNRGCRALTMSGGVKSSIVGDGMTRGPVIRFPTAMRAAEVLIWLEREENFEIIKAAFDSTSRFARLKRVQTRIAACYLFVRLVAKTGDAMGMNMLSKGAELAMERLKQEFPDMELLGLSGNVCTDKKPAAINWIEGRGKSVVAEAHLPAKIVSEVLKTDVEALVRLNISKNLIGSSMAGSIGGFNAHAANIVTAIYIATGQDPAQNISSSNCITIIESRGQDNKDLYISCTMPSMELGTIGGGTILSPQASCLDLLGVRGSCADEPGRNAKQLASIICGTVLAAELSLMSALAADHLVKAHMKHNRSNVSLNAAPTTLPSQSSSANLFTANCKQ
ncbi:3-hydroxy-3-methylglutaryl-coenzyme A reductase [Halotydeus destructor]|nr:3-hydroxy-3-methylglutaryl-coenzyme A reductase [Halotydeus destructor]